LPRKYWVSNIMSTKVTAKQFKSFCRKLNKWVRKLGLQSWAVHVDHKDKAPDADEPADELGNLSWVLYVYESQIAQINLCKTWDGPFTDKMSDMAAFHECMHLLLAPLMELFEGDEQIKAIAAKEEHLVIAALERMMFDKIPSDGIIKEGKK